MKRKRAVQVIRQDIAKGGRQTKKELLDNVRKALARRGIKEKK